VRAEGLVHVRSMLPATVEYELRYWVMSFIAGSSAGIPIGLRPRPRTRPLLKRSDYTLMQHTSNGEAASHPPGIAP